MSANLKDATKELNKESVLDRTNSTKYVHYTVLATFPVAQ